MASAGKNFWRACLARVGCQVGIKVEFWPGRLAGGEDVCGLGIIVETVDGFCRSAIILHEADFEGHSQVWYVDCSADGAGQMVSEQAVIAKLPSEKITDEKDGDGRRRACLVGLIGASRERDALARWLTFPFKAGGAASGGGHGEYSLP